jgi:hypothetical protein
MEEPLSTRGIESSPGHTPGKSEALCKVSRLPSGDTESPNVPKQPRNLTVNIN